MKNNSTSRRNFIKQALLGTAGLSVTSAAQLGLMKAAFADGTSKANANDYKALVCIYLYGGNDSANTIVPVEGLARTNYESMRGNLAVTDPLAFTSNVEGGLGFHPQMAQLKTLYDQGKVAIQANIGTHYGDRFAHNSQQEAWMRGAELKYSKGNGWAAKMLELLADTTTPHYLQNVSLFGKNTWSAGQITNPFSIGSNSVPEIALYHHHDNALARKDNLEQHFKNQATADNVLIREYAKSFLRTEDQTQDIIQSLTEVEPVEGFGDSALSQQLRRVSELIQLRTKYDVSRQIFFVGLPGFDTHRGQSDIQRNGLGYHANLLADLSDSMSAFYNSMVNMGLEDQVTTFTMSEFGRTMTHNTGNGTDHGWGGHQFILGGAVNGGIYGEMPRIALDADNVMGKGILEPTTHAEQMTSSLASWYGLSQSQRREIFPILDSLEPMNYFKT